MTVGATRKRKNVKGGGWKEIRKLFDVNIKAVSRRNNELIDEHKIAESDVINTGC